MVTIARGNYGSNGKEVRHFARVARCLKASFYFLSFLAIGSLIALGVLFDMGGGGDSPREPQIKQR